MAASATFALKAGVWFRRGRLLMVTPDSRGTACPPSGRNSTYRPVQISGTGSYSRRPKSLEGFRFGDGKTFADVVDAGQSQPPQCDVFRFERLALFGSRGQIAQSLAQRLIDDVL